jgi:hypothetical protein
MNKETIEQAAERIYPNKPYATGDRGIMYDEYAKQRIAFIEGAKWYKENGRDKVIVDEDKVIKVDPKLVKYV